MPESPVAMEQAPDKSVVELPSSVFVLACVVAALALVVASRSWQPPIGLLAAEIFATIIGLFAFGSFRYRIHKNALTYGMALVIGATFFGIAWPGSQLRAEVAAQGWQAWLPFLRHHLLTWHGLDELVHADTMAFILGLTFFVAVIAQTRLLETITFALLRRYRGYVLPTVISVTAVVAFSSGILDGVSMIGLTIRTLVIIMFLAREPVGTVRYAVMVCTVVTTVCGMWLAYGEPPNLIMKANLTAPTGESYLTNGFFLRYCLPAAIASYLVIAWNLRLRVGRARVDLHDMDVLDANAESVRFLQAARHGEVLTSIETLESQEKHLGEGPSERVQERIRHGETLGEAMVRENVPAAQRRRVLGEFVSEDLADSLDQHYVHAVAGNEAEARRTEREVRAAMRRLTPQRVHAQRLGIASLVVFIACLVWHAWDHRVPLFVASFGGFALSLIGIVRIPRMVRLALHEARVEFAEYYFLFPLFLSITLLTHVGFFEQFQELLRTGIARIGHSHVAFAQFIGCTVLSALLDNNVVADFGSRAILGLELAVLHLFAMAQIAGYAVGGCWTHIGSAQSVVAFAFIRRDVDEGYTPVQWIKEMTPVILEVALALTVIIYIEGLLLSYLH
jgi:hypothetical protein